MRSRIIWSFGLESFRKVVRQLIETGSGPDWIFDVETPRQCVERHVHVCIPTVSNKQLEPPFLTSLQMVAPIGDRPKQKKNLHPYLIPAIPVMLTTKVHTWRQSQNRKRGSKKSTRSNNRRASTLETSSNMFKTQCRNDLSMKSSPNAKSPSLFFPSSNASSQKFTPVPIPKYSLHA